MKRPPLILCLATLFLAASIPAASQTGASTWTDPQSGLTWTRQDSGVKQNWNEAMGYCRGLQLAGHSDWRLPSIEELTAMADNGGGSHFDTHTKGNLNVWSATPAPPADDGSAQAWLFRLHIAGTMSAKFRFPPLVAAASAFCVSGMPPQTAQGPNLEQTVTWLRAKLSADAIEHLQLTKNGILNIPVGTDAYYRVDLSGVRTIGQEECEEYDKEKDSTKTYPCIHMTGGPWERYINPDKRTGDDRKAMYVWFRPGTDMGPILKAFKRLAVLDGAKLVDDDLFK